ncbi:MAG: phosphotransferase family protein [Burkholderiaceae bacterium]|nr:phosphotransferase family protein [Burkholderiaceae bacterium]
MPKTAEAPPAHPHQSPATDGHAIDTQRLSDWMAAHIPWFNGPLQVTRFKGGQSNPTYRLDTPTKVYVLRSKPGPVAKLLPSAHAIEREFRVMSALKSSAVPVAAMLGLCEDESVIGRAFYIMDHVPGRVFWEQSLPNVGRDDRRSIYLEMNRVLAELHLINPQRVGLADFGKPGNYFERQISRWTKQYLSSVTDPIPEMEQLIEWLPANIPDSAQATDRVSIVHGDYRLDNIMFYAASPHAAAVLDWELSTLGHPLADFSYHCMSWHIPPGVFRGLAGLDLGALNIPTEKEYIALYCERTRFITPEALEADWGFYLAYNMFRLAAILQGIAKRVQAGTASSAQALQSAAGARPMAHSAWAMAQAQG